MTATAARGLGWSLAVAAYVASHVGWMGGDALMLACGIAVVVCAVACAVLAWRARCPDLWAAAVLSIVAPVMVIAWWAPFFAP
ncbi:hypothetical protein [Corynebacterium sp. 335C]